MSDVSKSLVPTNIQELFLPLSRVHSYGTRASTSQNFYRKKSNLEIKKNSFSRLGAKLWNEIPNKLRTLSKHKLKFNIRASLLDILETCNTYYETDEFILKMKKAEPIIFFVILPIKTASYCFVFPFLLRVLNASFSYVFLRKIIIFAIS